MRPDECDTSDLNDKHVFSSPDHPIYSCALIQVQRNSLALENMNTLANAAVYLTSHLAGSFASAMQGKCKPFFPKPPL